MDETTVGSVDIGTFTAETLCEGPEMHVRLCGTADLTVQAHLERLLSDVHAETSRAGSTHVTVDVSAVDFMNSACLKAFVSWVTTIRAMPRGRYQITFVFRPDVWWQRRSLNPIVALSDGVADTRSSEPS